MKKLQTVLLSLLAAVLLAGTAFADVVAGPVFALALGVPIFAIVVVIIVVVLVIRTVARTAKQKKDAEEMSCRHEDSESNARKSSWDNRDPWD